MSYNVNSLTTKHTKKYFRVDEVARYFSISKRTIYRLIANDELRGIKIREALRIHRNDLEKYEQRIRGD